MTIFNFPWDQPARPDVLNLIHLPVDEQFKQIMLQYDPDDKECLALVLMGGGLFGAEEFARVYRLKELGVLRRVKIIVGTSVGAINALLVALYEDDLDKALAVWARITKDTDVYDGSMDNWFGHLWATITKQKSLLNPKGLYKLINSNFGGKFNDSFRIKIVTTASRVRDGKDLVYTGHVDAALCAKMSSAMFPGFPAISGPDGLVIDGGLGNNMPVETAIREGATKIILIGTSPDDIPANEPKSSDMVTVASMQLGAVMKKFEDRVWDWVEEYNKDPNHEAVEVDAYYPLKTRGSVLSAKETHDRIPGRVHSHVH